MWPPSVEAPCHFGTTVKAQEKALPVPLLLPSSRLSKKRVDRVHVLSNKRSGKGRGKD